MEKFGWTAIFEDGKVIQQYPEEGVDNTLELGKQVLPNMESLKQFHVGGMGQRIGIDLKERYFIIGNEIVPFLSHSKTIKLVYFFTRQVTTDAATLADLEKLAVGFELPRIYTVGYEDENGKLFLNILEGSGAFFFSNTNP